MERDDTRYAHYKDIAISTHTLTWSVTRPCSLQSQLPNISTHTLTWSVTHSCLLCSILLQDFNSHAHVERD